MREYRQTTKSGNHIKILGLLNIFHRPRPNNTDESDESIESPTLFEELILAERHIYHQRAIRHWRTIQNLLWQTLKISSWIVVILTMSIFIDDLVHVGAYDNWHSYLSSDNIDISAIVEAKESFSIPAPWRKTSQLYTTLSIAYDDVVMLDDSADSGQFVARFQLPDGTYALHTFTRSDMEQYLRESFYEYSPNPWVSQNQQVIGSGSLHWLHAFIFRIYQETTLFFGFHSGWGPMILYILFILVVAFTAVLLKIECDIIIDKHQQYCGEYEEKLSLKDSKDNDKAAEDTKVDEDGSDEEFDYDFDADFGDRPSSEASDYSSDKGGEP